VFRILLNLLFYKKKRLSPEHWAHPIHALTQLLKVYHVPCKNNYFITSGHYLKPDYYKLRYLPVKKNENKRLNTNLSAEKEDFDIFIYNYQICPEAATMTGDFVAPDEDPTLSTVLTTSSPSTTFPKTTCLPSNHEVSAVQRKN